jgi:hypothetical protein
MIELAPAGAARAVRNSGKESGLVRHRLSAWSAAHFRSVRLQGFSHALQRHLSTGRSRPIRADGEKLALLLAHVLPIPVALLGKQPALDRASASVHAATGSRSPRTSRRIPPHGRDGGARGG